MDKARIWIVVNGKEKQFNTAIDAAWEIWRQRKLAEPAEYRVMPPEAETEVMAELLVIEMVESHKS
jgi:hypothetical protein